MIPCLPRVGAVYLLIDWLKQRANPREALIPGTSILIYEFRQSDVASILTSGCLNNCEKDR
jgi:hypothetical protein